jgi:hypothetical protein
LTSKKSGGNLVKLSTSLNHYPYLNIDQRPSVPDEYGGGEFDLLLTTGVYQKIIQAMQDIAPPQFEKTA